MGSAAASRGDNQQATDLIEQSLALGRNAGEQWFVAYLLLTLGARALDDGEYDKAVSHYTESLPMFRDTNDVTGIACALAGLGTVAGCKVIMSEGSGSTRRLWPTSEIPAKGQPSAFASSAKRAVKWTPSSGQR